MAGNPQTKERLRQAEARILELEAEIATYEREGVPKAAPIKRRTYDERIIDELLRWSAEGQFLEEMLATWCIDDDTFKQWIDDHEELREVIGIAKMRAKGALLRELRQALRTRTAFPVALAERIIKMIEADRSDGVGGAEDLVHVHGGKMSSDQPASAPDARAKPIELIS